MNVVGGPPLETVERVAKAIFMVDPLSGSLTWVELSPRTRDVYRAFAEAAIRELQQCALVSF